MNTADGALSRLTKCLEMTSSSFDSEALAAVRKANAIREGLHIMWSDLLPPPRPSAPESPRGQDDFKEIFETIWEFNPLSPKWRPIVANIEEFWLDRGYLTSRQKRLILKFHDTALRNMAAGKAAQ